jgi:predicted MFS family arabinose efflux permease
MQGEHSSRWAIRSAGSILAILAVINFLNYVDRMIIGGVGALLKETFHLSSSRLGALQTAFMVVHSVASVPLGYVADRYRRRMLIAVGVALWSVSTAAAGLAHTYAQLFAARAAVGIGEATYAPAASALISERFSASQRARAMGIFQLGMVMGSGGGYAAGFVGKAWGWQAAFLMVGLPGLVLVALVLLIDEGPRAAPVAVEPRRVGPDAPWSVATAVWIVATGVLVTFFIGAVGIWGIPFILRAHYGGNPDLVPRVLVEFGGFSFLATILGTIAGAFVADRFERARPGAGRLLTIAISVFVAAPLAVFGILVRTKVVQIAAITGGVFFMAWYLGPILAALHDAVPARLRGTATGVYFFAVHALGDGISPLVVGRIDDATGSLRPGLLLAVALAAVGGICALAAAAGARRTAELKAAPGEG